MNKESLKSNHKNSSNLIRKEIYNENLKMFKTWYPSKHNGKKVIQSKVYKEEFKVNSNNNFDTKFECKNMDCSEIALELEYEGLNPVILNTANEKIPCYGYKEGINSFESSLCIMSNLSLSLYEFGSPKLKVIKELELDHIDNVYPLNENYGGIYSSNVMFFRHNIDKDYALREGIFESNVITISSLSNSKNNKYKTIPEYFKEDGYLSNKGIEVEKNKMRTIFRIALDNNHDSIVLNVFGSGYGNLKPDEVSSLFNEVLKEDEFYNKFKKIVFAIYEGKGNKVEKEGKYKPFYDLFNK